MNPIRFFIFTLFTFVAFSGIAQTDTTFLREKFKTHIEFLADDRLEGRGTGSAGEMLAAHYIAGEFNAIGLLPNGSDPANAFFQEFSFSSGAEFANRNLAIQQKALPENEYDIFPFSGSGDIQGTLQYLGYGIEAPDIKHNDYEGRNDLRGKIFIIRLGSPKGLDPHSEFAPYTGKRQKVQTAIKFGARAVIFVNHDPEIKEETDPHQKVVPMDIPVVMLFGGAEKYTDDYCKTLSDQIASVKVERKEIRLTGRNVIGYLDRGAEQTVVLGAHYDHLGFGEAGGSLSTGGKEIHNGADDNASGTAMLLELARTISAGNNRKYNYLFIAFSGEELGLLGSNYFVKNSTIPVAGMNCMINFDMVGRLDEEDWKMAINGTGTSPFWSAEISSLDSTSFRGILKTKSSESGVGPSDHTSFYNQNIPVLHFFSGTHPDYHKPSDDADKINYRGMVLIYCYVRDLIGRIENSGTLEFTATKAAEEKSVPAWKISLGVIPDYMFEGKGLKIDGVSAGKPAEKAGIQAGDIVVRIADVEVTDIYSYMEGLSRLKEGQKAKVVIMRGTRVMKKELQF